jgi:hypothetical protein
MAHYYEPMLKIVEKMRMEQGKNPKCAGILDALEQEAVMHRKFGKWYRYTFFVMQRAQGTEDKVLC